MNSEILRLRTSSSAQNDMWCADCVTNAVILSGAKRNRRIPYG